jgi:SAM-dependent methyltransferase
MGKTNTRWHTLRGLQTGIAKYHFASRFVKGKTVLDVACGDGMGTAYLASNGAKCVCGGDVEADAVRRAGHLWRASCALAVLDACYLPFGDAVFDVIVSIETIEHLSDHEQFLAECRRVLRDDGLFICSTVNRETFSPGSNRPWFPGHLRELSIGEFRFLVEQYFADVAIYGLPWNEKYGRLDRAIVKYQATLQDLMLSTAFTRSVVRLMTRFFFPRYQLVALDEVNPSQLGDFLTDEYAPIPLSDVSSNSINIIAVATKTGRRNQDGNQESVHRADLETPHRLSCQGTHPLSPRRLRIRDPGRVG